MIKQAIIPLAGLGTRVLPLTSVLPKELLPINGKPEAVDDQLFWAGITTLARLPSSVIPVGTAADNLPCGLQIITDYLEDHTALEFAGLAEQILGGFIPPNGFH